MTNSRQVRPSEGYTTADFRRSMTDVFEAARYQDAIVNVSHHGKPWVSVVSSQAAQHIQRIREIGNIEPDELKKAVSSLGSAISIEDLALRIARRRTDS